MQIAVTYKDGVLIPAKPLQLKQKNFLVSIPDAAIAASKPVKEFTPPMRERIDQILGKYVKPRAAVATDEDKALWQQHLLDKYQQ